MKGFKSVKQTITSSKITILDLLKNNPKESVISTLIILSIGSIIIFFGLNHIISSFIISPETIINAGDAFNANTANSIFGVLIMIFALPLFLTGRLIIESHKFGIILAGCLGSSIFIASVVQILPEIGYILGALLIIASILGVLGRRKIDIQFRDSATSTESIIEFVTLFFALISVAVLFGFLLYVGIRGVEYLSIDLVTEPWTTYSDARERLYARVIDQAGLLPEYITKKPEISDFLNLPIGGLSHQIIGTLLLVGLCGLIASPLGLGAGIYLSEYAREGIITDAIRLFIVTLAGVPSIVIGLVGYGFFAFQLGWGRSWLGGSLSLMFMILPWTVSTAEEAIKVVPNNYREASLALGASKWQAIRRVVISAALPGIITGILLGIGKAMGETAVVMLVAGDYGTYKLPSQLSLTDGSIPSLTVWVLGASEWLFAPPWAAMTAWEGRNFALAGTLILIIMFLIISLIALVIRNHLMKKLGKGL